MLSNIKIGTAGWSYKDWNGRVYPRELKPSDRLSFMANIFDTIEINSTFYAIPNRSLVQRWSTEVEDKENFLFTCKAVRTLTHEKEFDIKTAQEFRAALSPLTESHKLGAVLAQFPWFFNYTVKNFDRVKRICGHLAGMPLIVEVRHHSFLNDSFFSFLEDYNIGIANIDLPASRSSMPITSLCFGENAYFRFHGRNSDAWFDTKAGRDKKYDYCYSEKELKPWTEIIKELAAKSKCIFVITNNHYRGQAVANAFDIERLLGGKPAIPETLKKVFPYLNDNGIAKNEINQNNS